MFITEKNLKLRVHKKWFLYILFTVVAIPLPNISSNIPLPMFDINRSFFLSNPVSTIEQIFIRWPRERAENILNCRGKNYHIDFLACCLANLSYKINLILKS